MSQRVLYLLLFSILNVSFVLSQTQRTDSISKRQVDSLRLPYPFKDFRHTLFSKKYSSFALPLPQNIKREVVYDPISKQYSIQENIGTRKFRPPIFLDQEEYQYLEFAQQKKNYWEYLSDAALQDERRKRLIPTIEIHSPAFERIFGGNTIDITPRGSIDVILQAQHNLNDNPMFNETQRNLWGLDFDQNINLNLNGTIGERLKVQTNFNSQAQFDFENQIRFEYLPKDDDILRSLEVGNVNMPLNTTLIQGAESLFGVKAQLQFGRLTMTGLLSQQRSRTREITITNGMIDTETNMDLSQYEDNQHYFLAHYFRDNYDRALEMLPIVNSNINITQIEVWVSNYGSQQENARDIIALLDLGEYDPYSSAIASGTVRLPSSGIPGQTASSSNNLLELIGEQGRDPNGTFLSNFFAGTGREDNYARVTFARKLTEGQDFTVNRKLGYISLRSALQRDQVLSVTYRYIANGVEYQVGEFGTDMTTSTTNPRALYTKLLKNQILKTDLPTWDLMMKNIYVLPSRNISPDNFTLQIYRTDNETNAVRPVIYEGQQVANQTWLQVMGLDRLTQQNGIGSDGYFDFIEGYTIDSQSGRIIFPTIEPFGRNLSSQFTASEDRLANKYVFQELYTHTKADAIQLFPDKNRYSIRGKMSGRNSSEFHLGVMNIQPNSIRVTVGGMPLEPNQDYIVDPQVGTLRILNEAILLSGQPISVFVEDDTMYGIQQKSLFGARLDYQHNPNLHIGATFMKLTEKPLTEKVNIGFEPVSNSVIGTDISYSTSSRWLTRMVNKLPFINTKEESFVTFYGEAAYLIPRNPRGLNHQKGVTYIDDFENSVSYIDLKSHVGWQLSSTPRMFAESDLYDDLQYGHNRALMSLYNIDPIFYKRSSPLHPRLDANQLSDHRVREVTVQEIFPNKDSKTGVDSYLPTLDMAFYPTIRGPYNYGTNNLLPNGTFSNPKDKWGGFFRKIDQTDFEAQNIEFIEIWMMDPSMTNANQEGGDIYFNIGNISEDILKDGRRSFENSIPTNGNTATLDQTKWGYVTKNQPIIQAFDNKPDNRIRQDVGLDGLSDAQEASFHQQFLSQTQGILLPDAYEKLQQDPSTDNYNYFIGNQYNQSQGILERYKNYRGVEGNSRTNEQSRTDFGVDNAANTLLPDGEDVNQDNMMNELDAYLQYRISTRPQDMQVGKNHIVDEYTAQVTLLNQRQVDVKWYKFRIALNEHESSHGNIRDLKSVQFIRMFMTNYADTSVVRFGKLQLVRGEWRKYNAENQGDKVIVDPQLGIIGPDQSNIHVANINIEENGNRSPIPYVVPPGINRQIDLSNNNLDVQLNEQSLSLEIQHLRDGYGRATYRTMSNDYRAYGRMEMFVHAEGQNLRDGEAHAFVRIGTDDRYNYYEYEMPLSVTSYGSVSAENIWPEANRMNIELSWFQDAKLARDKALLNGKPWPADVPYEYLEGEHIIRVMGAPDLSAVKYYMIGIKNPYQHRNNTSADDGRDISGEFWFNELRLTDFDDQAGWAATARIDVKLADLANIAVSGRKSSVGWGSIYQRRSERSRSEDLFFDVTSNAELGKFFHPQHGIAIPFYFNLSHQLSTPEYNPLYPDIEMERTLEGLSRTAQDSLLRRVNSFTKRSGFSFNNVRKIRTDDKESMPWDIENFSASYAFTNYSHYDFNTENAVQKTYRGSLSYLFSSTAPVSFKPFHFIKNPNLKLFKELDFNLLPNFINFRLDVNRIYNENTFRDNSSNNTLPTLYNKNFNMNRIYGISWDLTNSLRLDFNATNYSIIDEPNGRITSQARDTLWNNFWKMGRTTDYNHMLNVTYTFPFHKIPFMEWLTLTTRYGTQFHWQSEPLMAMQNTNISIGNSIQNNRTIQINPTLNMMALYNKFGFIRRNSGRAAKGSSAFWVQLLTSVRNMNASYLKTEGMHLPGYLPRTNALGYDFDSNAPSWGFIFGSQADILTKSAMNGWLSSDTLQTQLFTKTYAENLSGIIGLEPIKGLRLDLTFTRVDNYNKSVEYRIEQNQQNVISTTPYTTGNYTISQIGLTSSFKDYETLFHDFESNRFHLSHRIAMSNPHSDPGSNIQRLDNGKYADGYGKDQQDVVVASFLSTFLGKKGNAFKPTFPLPNWRLNYNGLGQFEALKDIFAAVSIHHAYQSEYLISGYNSVLRYQEIDGKPFVRDANENFLPAYQYQQISLMDRFVPLIGLDVRFKNNLSANSEYRRSKNILLSLLNSQLSTMSEDSYIVGLGYRKQNIRLPFGIFEDKRWNNDINFRCDFSLNDRKTTILQADAGFSEISAGNKSISFNPTLDYTVNNTYMIRLFYNSNIVKPYTSQSFATSYTYFGLNLRILFQ